MLELNKQTEIPRSFGGDIKLHPAGPKSTLMKGMKFSSWPDHKINIYCSMVCLFFSSWHWLTSADKLLEQMDCVIWNGNDCVPSRVKFR